ncbi:MAG TPA: glycoside hydrolase family 130 protein [Hanamia sp.]|nr:glycoside hydrolase family 130 protein [Hanamia sp.]
MAVTINRSNIKLSPDHKKVIPRFFNTGNERSHQLILKILQLDDTCVETLLHNVFSEFSGRYQNIEAVFLQHYQEIEHLLTEKDKSTLSGNKMLLTGAYFTMEYSIESAALFNPSIVEDINQSGADKEEKKVIVSFRATGESHISSIVFKRGIIKRDGSIHFEPSGKFIAEGAVTQRERKSKAAFRKVLTHVNFPEEILLNILDQLNDQFSYKELETALKNSLPAIGSPAEEMKLKHEIFSTVNTSYEIHFDTNSLLSERVIFPVTGAEKNGMEDARFVQFKEDDGKLSYIATYTAYDGSVILPQLIITKDFCHFKIAPLHGKGAVNKNLALFPRKINGKYAMLSRIDGINNYIMLSDDLYIWEGATLLQQPKYPWEFVQIGNAGSPVETEKGWLVITHGVGPMRKYCLGASLFDLNDPTIELGRLREPLLMPDEDERDGYVPNVVYSCGSIIHGNKLFIPYAVSDYASSFATVSLNELLDTLLESK